MHSNVSNVRFVGWACFVRLRNMSITKNPVKLRNAKNKKWHATEEGEPTNHGFAVSNSV